MESRREEVEINLKKRKILFALLALLLVYLVWISFLVLNFKPYKSGTLNTLEIEGTYHIHTRFSDGRKSVDEIAHLASRAHLDFIILTDHGKPNFKSLASQGWKQGVLVLAGSELSVSRGHLVSLDFALPTRPFSQNTEQAVQEVSALGGFCIIAHPYSKVRWSWGEFIEYSGLELINANTMLKRNYLLLTPYLPALLVKPEYALLKILEEPALSLKKWDELNNLHPIYGYFSVDSHLLYRPLLSFLHLHLLLKRPLPRGFDEARREVYEALRKGKFYNVIEAASEARGFRFWAEQGNQTVSMGETLVSNSTVLFRIETPFPFAKETHLVHNGKILLRSRENSLSYEAAQPGNYRVEVYLRGKTPLSKNIPWIVSNPIFLKKG